jgi:tetratricopeptide (TPR) repeat protein
VKTTRIIFYASLIACSLVFSGCASIYGSYFMEDPLSAEEHNNLGVIYEREGKYDLAIREYKKALSRDGKLVVPLVNIGNIYRKQGEYDKAKKYYKHALKRDEHNIQAANNLASVYLEMGGDYQEGINVLLYAADGQKQLPAYALDTLGVLYFKTGDRGKAEEMLKEACTRGSGDEKLRSEINGHLMEIGDSSGCK